MGLGIITRFLKNEVGCRGVHSPLLALKMKGAYDPRWEASSIWKKARKQIGFRKEHVLGVTP